LAIKLCINHLKKHKVNKISALPFAKRKSSGAQSLRRPLSRRQRTFHRAWMQISLVLIIFHIL
jgi:hypothetical protein